MRVFITGGSGFVGKVLSRQLVAQGYEVSILTRNSSSDRNPPGDAIFIHGNPTEKGPWQDRAAHWGVVTSGSPGFMNRIW